MISGHGSFSEVEVRPDCRGRNRCRSSSISGPSATTSWKAPARSAWQRLVNLRERGDRGSYADRALSSTDFGLSERDVDELERHQARSRMSPTAVGVDCQLSKGADRRATSKLECRNDLWSEFARRRFLVRTAGGCHESSRRFSAVHAQLHAGAQAFRSRRQRQLRRRQAVLLERGRRAAALKRTDESMPPRQSREGDRRHLRRRDAGRQDERGRAVAQIARAGAERCACGMSLSALS